MALINFRLWWLMLIAMPSLASAYRLPNDLVPHYYNLSILTNLADLNQNFTFSGNVAILVEVKSATDKIVVHSRNLNINENGVRVIKTDAGVLDGCATGIVPSVDIVSHSYDSELDFYFIHLTKQLNPKFNYSICIPFDGELTEGLAGFYRSNYKQLSNGAKRWLAVTQFESTDARRAFPCFDEPGLKAQFELTLGHVATKSAVSNMPKVSTSPISDMKGWVWERFQATVPMSTYLLAFLVSDMDYRVSPQKKSNNVKFRVWARKDAIGQVDYAADIGPKVLEDFERYFDVKYPLPKMDMVAVPDFSAGAMENWGLITYRETALLFDPKYTSASDQPYVASVISHEIAHQWFGNLVTMKWWTDLWLNEGFATYMASQETAKLHPEWNYLDDSVVNNILSVLRLDALQSSHPISVPIGHPRQIPEIFDHISYKKGSYMLRMINRFLGEETFRSGVSNYLKKHAYANAEQDDLWTSLTEEAHRRKVLPAERTVKQIMDSWTLQTGYPLLTVTRNYNNRSAKINQARYLSDRTSVTAVENTTWWIPLTYTTSSERAFNNSMPRLWLPQGQREISIDALPDDDWLIFNIQLSGLYRINYDDENWERISKAMNSENFMDIPTLNRVQLLDDAYNLARTGDLKYSTLMKLLPYLSRESEYLPWKSALTGLRHLDRLLRGYPLYGAFKDYVRILLAPAYNTTSMQDLKDTPENLQKIKLQTLIASWACKLNLGDCRAKATHLFRQWMSTNNPDENNPIPKNWRSNVYCYAISQGGENEWNFAWKRYLKANSGAHKSDLLGALSCTREPWLLNRYLRWAIDEKSGIKRQDSRSVFSGVADDELGYFLAKAFFTENIAQFYQHHGSKTARLSSYIGALTAHVTTQSELDEYKKFIEKNEIYLKGAEQGVRQALEKAKVNVQWQLNFYSGVSRLLADPNENTIFPIA